MTTWFKPNNATLIVVGDTTLAEDQAEAGEACSGRGKPAEVPKKNLHPGAASAEADDLPVTSPEHSTRL